MLARLLDLVLLVADWRCLLRLDNVGDPARNECLAALIDNDWLGIDHLLARCNILFLNTRLGFDRGCVEVDDLIVLAIGAFVIGHIGCWQLLVGALDRLGRLCLVRYGKRVTGAVPCTLHKSVMRVSLFGGGQGGHLIGTV